MNWLIPILLALGRAFRGVGKAYHENKPDFEFNWYRFIGSIVLAFVIGMGLQLGFDVATFYGLITTVVGTWLGTDYIEDLLRYLEEEPSKVIHL